MTRAAALATPTRGVLPDNSTSTTGQRAREVLKNLVEAELATMGANNNERREDLEDAEEADGYRHLLYIYVHFQK